MQPTIYTHYAPLPIALPAMPYIRPYLTARLADLQTMIAVNAGDGYDVVK